MVVEAEADETPSPPLAPLPRFAGGRIFFGWYVVTAALFAQFVAAGVQAYLPGVFLDPMRDDLGWSRSQFTIALSVGQFATAFVGFFIGSRIDRHGPRPLMLIGAAVLAVSLLLTSFVDELWQWLLLRGLATMVGTALIGNLVVNVTLSKWFVEHRGVAIGIAAIGLSLGGIVLTPLMTVVVDEYGWRVGWRVIAFATVLVIVPVALIMRRQPEDFGLHPDGKSDAEVRAGQAEQAAADYANSMTRGEALRTRSLYLVVFAFGLAGASVVTLLFHSIAFLTDAGFSRGEAALQISVFALPSALTKPFWGLASERAHPRYLSAGAFVVAGFAMFSIVLAARSGSIVLLSASFAVLGVGLGGILPLQETIWASYFGRRYLGEVRSVALPFAVLVSAIAPLLAAVYADRVGNYEGAFFAASLAWFFACALILLARPPIARRGGTVPAEAARS